MCLCSVYDVISIRIKKPPVGNGGAWGTIRVSVTGPCATCLRCLLACPSREAPLLRGGDIRSGGRGRQGDMADKMSPEGAFSLHLLRPLVDIGRMVPRYAGVTGISHSQRITLSASHRGPPCMISMIFTSLPMTGTNCTIRAPKRAISTG